MKTALRKGDCSTLNIYSVETYEGTLGWATLPRLCKRGKTMDGVVFLHSTRPYGSMTDYNEGDTLVHEVGHWMGLYHTFRGGCNDGDDKDSAIAVNTPAEREPAYGCPVGRDTCSGDPGEDPVRNYMNYSVDECMDHFTSGQFEQMMAMW
eukprot:CAMPEP_0172519596 /NCGR_PEP_ID=MMETSP1066-20121228/291513_1 /TAXON_ID=671091 /ORGANISM="Coscinodiscus wailesii, Strain CCMP2513" /LENGTH=149 /DNA_ID=CAMNT_0013302215 /DNA_START=439 /DNA_END=885 /DNA_ORIENTATION=-